MFFLSKSAREKVRHGNGANAGGIPAQTACHHQPVNVSAHTKANGCPSRIRNTGQIGNARQAHQQPAGHIRRLGTHGSNHRPQPTAAQIEIVHCIVALGTHNTNSQHSDQVHGYRDQNTNLCTGHKQYLQQNLALCSTTGAKQYNL